MNNRQRQQQMFDESRQNLIVGFEKDCPIPPRQLTDIDNSSPYVVQSFTSGLTAEVFHLRIHGTDYTLKKKRAQSKVKNLDGKYSFLNEVQRRADFSRLKKHSSDYQYIVDTVYADYRLGIILSPWIEGEPVADLHPLHLEQLYSTLLACEKAGLFEWDLCSGNLLIDNHGQLKLFDFGYMYPFDPLTELNSNGLNDEIFHLSERFETRFLFGWLLEKNLKAEQQLSLYKQVKKIALCTYENKRQWLRENQAVSAVLDQTERIILQCKTALKDQASLQQSFLLDSFRSYVLDIEDDLHGKSCTAGTLQKIEAVQRAILKDFLLLQQQGMLFYGNKGLSQQQLIESYRSKEQQAKSYLIEKDSQPV